MKILCFHLALAPYRLDFFNIMSEMTDFKLVLLQDNLANQKFETNSLFARLNAKYSFLCGRHIFGRQIRLGIGRIVDEYAPQVVMGYESSLLTMQLLIWRMFNRRKVLIWTCMDDCPSMILTRCGFRKWIRNLVIRYVDKIIVPSERAKEAYCVAIPNVGNEKFAVVPIIHDIASIRTNAASVYSKGKAWRCAHIARKFNRVLLFVGRLTSVKNLVWLISQMKEIDDETCLVIVGTGDLESELRKIVKKIKVENRVLFVGRHEGDDLYSFMAMADGLILCSNHETYGAVVAEALQWGTPCIVSDNCGAVVLINDRVNGCIFKYNDIIDFLSALNELPARTNKPILEVDLRTAISDLIK